MLEDILVYWMSLSWIPKGILEKVLKISFNLNMVSVLDILTLSLGPNGMF
jgi:hypothetical protein